jgi:hypothetical protein
LPRSALLAADARVRESDVVETAIEAFRIGWVL